MRFYVPHRARYLRKALEHMRSTSDVWFTAGAQIVASYSAQCQQKEQP
jgi:hypothetical protein